MLVKSTTVAGHAQDSQKANRSAIRQTSRVIKDERPGLTFERFFTRQGVDPFDTVEWESRDAVISGADVQQLPCTGATEQLWVATPAGGDRFTVVNTAVDRCLDVTDGRKEDEATVILWKCHGRSNQVWRIVPAGPNFTLVNVNSDKCLDVPGARVDQGLSMQQFTCNGTNAQQWTFAD